MSLSSEPPRGTGPSLGALVLYVLIAFLFLVFALMPRPAPAAPPGTGAGGLPGGLFLKDDDNEGHSRAPAIETEIEIRVGGVVARTRVSQRFANPTGRWMEGIYVFPLPEEAAVDALEMRLGDKLVIGKISPRAQAKRTYSEARSAGKAASLVEQERPNIFTASVANIPPGDAITIVIEYQEKLGWRDGRFELRLPLVVGPRYIPPLRPLMVVGGGPSLAARPVPDADRITPPLRGPTEGKGNPVAITVSLDAGLALAELYSPSHKIEVEQSDDGPQRIRLSAGTEPADRDFRLIWVPAPDARPRAVLFGERAAGRRDLLLMLMPPSAEATPDAAAERLPREVIFVLDNSGSMHGESIAQAKAALGIALARLKPEDRFNLVRFNNDYSMLFPRARPATQGHVQRALGYLAALKAGGGTNMLPALAAVLDGGRDPSRLRQVVFLTDGAVGNEAELFRLIAERRGDSRLFPVGMGSAPNGHFMRRAARVGRGSFTYIADTGEAKARMTELFGKLERAVVTGLAIGWPDGAQAEAYPAPLPDLYHGEPLVLTAALPEHAAGAIAIAGRIGGRTWSTSIDLGSAAEAAGVAKLWARDKIAALEESRAFGADGPTVTAAVTEVALAHDLVSRYTSLIAIDATPIRPAAQPLDSAKLPTNLPKGWTYEGLYGERRLDSGPPANRPLLRKTQASGTPTPVQLAAAPAVQVVRLPQTDTHSLLYLVTGLAVAALGLLLLLVIRERPS